MESRLVQKLGDKSITKEQLLEKVRQNYDLIPELLSGISSSKPTIRYGCGKILMTRLLHFSESSINFR